MTPTERELLEKSRADLQGQQYDIAVRAEEKVEVTRADLVAVAPPDKRREAKRLANRIAEAEAYATTIRRYRDVVNFIYWRTRCEVEKTDRAIEGRKYLYEADQAFRDGDLEGARSNYEGAWERWSKIHEENPVLADDVTAEDLVDAVKEYRKLLDLMDEDFPPAGFKMLPLVAAYAEDFGFSDEEADAMLARLEEDENESESSNEDQKEEEVTEPADAATTDSPEAPDSSSPEEAEADQPAADDLSADKASDSPSDGEEAPSDGGDASKEAPSDPASDRAAESDEDVQSGDTADKPE